MVSDSVGSVTSSGATLTVNAAPVAPSIATQPASLTITSGQTATFSVTASGTAPLAYQWQLNGSPIGGATSASYTTPSEVTSNSGAQFSVAVSNSAGSVTSSGATLTVNAAAVAPPSTSTGLAGSKMGVNAAALIDYDDSQHMLVNLVKSSRGFASVNTPWDPVNSPASVDSNGWPTEDFGVYLITSPGDPLNRMVSQVYPSDLGTYQVSFNGTATIDLSYTANASVQNQVYNAATNTTTASITIGDQSAAGGFTFAVLFRNTNKGIQNLVINRPGIPLGSTQVFSTEFLNAVQPFAAVRFMDSLCTNGGPMGAVITSWSQRSTTATPLQNNLAQGCLSYDYIIEFANQTGKDVWINIPYSVNLADATPNNFVTQLATLIKNNLTNTNSHVYVEWSNEVWNNANTQSGYNTAAAVAEVASGDPDHFNFDGGNNQYYEGYRRIAYQGMLVSNLFRAVVGNSAMMTTIRPVLAMQYSYQHLLEDNLYYLNMFYGAPSNFFYGVAGAPYWNLYNTSGNSDFSTVNSLFEQMQATLTTYILPYADPGSTAGIGNDGYSPVNFLGLAQYYGLQSLSYEGGPDLSINTDPNAASLGEQSLSDPRYATMEQQFYSQWFGCGNGLMMYYNLSTPVTGQWGLYEDATVPTVKSQQMLQIASTPLANFTQCN